MENCPPERELEQCQQTLTLPYDNDRQSPVVSGVLIIVGLVGLFVLACSLSLP